MIVCIAVFFTAALSFTVLVPRQDFDRLGDKLRAYCSGTYDVAFLGSSWTEMNVDPGVFDAEMLKAGLETQSFNMGISGAYQGEISYVADRLMQSPDPLRYAVIDVTPWSPVQNSKLAELTFKEQNWHTLRNTRLALKADKGVPESDRKRLSKRHLRLFIGRLRRWGTLIDRPRPVEHRGFKPSPLKARRQEYERQFEDFNSGGGQSNPWEELDFAELDRTLERFRRRGIKPILVIPPVIFRSQILEAAREYAAQREGTLLLDFARPDAFPELFTYEARMDREHLNPTAVPAYSRMLANAVRDALARE